MNKIEKLIEELCPQGVEFRALGEVLDYEQPTKYIVSSTKYSDDFTMPVLTAGQTFILGYTDESEGMYDADKQNAVIIFDDFTTAFHWVDFNFKVKSSAMKMIRPRQNADIDFRFVYFAMRCIGYQPQDHARHWISKYSKIQIPIPPLAIQKEIVKILDNFTRLEAELEAELEARKKQYEHYREELLTFGDDVEFRALGEVCRNVSSGGTPKTTKKEYWENGTIPWMSSGEVNYGVIHSTDKKITQLGYDSSSTKMTPPDTVVMALAGQGKTRGMVAITKIELCTNQSLCSIVVSDELNAKYLYFYLKGRYADLRRISSGDGTRGGLNLTMIKNYQIPIPPLSKQKEIVAILDKFDALVNDISTGLPAEITARKKQYEYYRNQLLTFKPLETQDAN